MAERDAPVLGVQNLNVYYGHSHALQGVNLELQRGVLSVVGRNGMGKTTLCNAIMGLVPISSGAITLGGRTISGATSADIANSGIGYVPQGRRIWRSLTVDEHLRLVARRDGAWTTDRIYATFPRLAERKSHAGGHLSGGEQQMLAIGRALLLNPKLLLMDEPTEGLAPMIVRQVEEMLIRLGREGDVNVLIIEQNIGVACAVSERVAIMVNGRVHRIMDASALVGDRELQKTLLGVGRHVLDGMDDAAVGKPQADDAMRDGIARIFFSNPKTPTRWSQPVAARVIEGTARTQTRMDESDRKAVKPLGFGTRRHAEAVIVAGTFDTKNAELCFLAEQLKSQGLRVRQVDLSTNGKPSGADVPPHSIAGFHPRGTSGVFTGDRGTAVAGMALAFERWIRRQDGIAGIVGAGGSGATALVAPAMRVLPIGIPKLIVSTVASGDVSQYVGSADILMFHSVADVQGINSITREVLSNAAGALAGMVKNREIVETGIADKPAVGITMFGVTTPCVQQIAAALEADFDCLVFHATGVGGRSMEKLMDSGKLAAIIDMTTTEVCDMVADGVFAADEDRFGASIRAGVPFVGACGALDMVNFNARETVPERYRERLLYEHNPQITLMRTTPDENALMGRWIGDRLNEMTGPVRFFLPEGGVSLLDRPGEPFWDPEADTALFRSLEDTVRQTSDRKLVRTPHNINDGEFADLIVRTFRELHAQPIRRVARIR